MPQMAPINWLTLYFLWIFVFLLFIIINYYSFLYKPNFYKKISLKKNLNWKW